MEEQDQGSSAPQTKSVSKKSGGTKAVVIIVVVLAVLGVAGYLVSNYFAGRIAEKATVSLLSDALGGDVNFNSNGEGVSISNEDGSAQYGTSTEWPTDMPSIVPNFTYGKLSMTTKNSSGEDSWTLYYENVASGSLEDYTSKLTSKGWEASTETTMDTGSYIQMSNGDYQIMVISDDSGQSASIVVTKSVPQE